MKEYFNIHNHTMYSNIRLLDCINRPKDLIKTAKELGLSGLAITDHECLSAHMDVNKFAKTLQETDPNFTIALGNEIYLTDTRESGQKYYHFILIAKDSIGHKALRELSSKAWENCYTDRRMERVPTLKSELKETVNKYKGHLIATTACIGGELGTLILKLHQCELVNDMRNASVYYQQIISFLEYCKDLFGEDFYLECAPSDKEDQITVNRRLLKIAEGLDLKLTIGTDAHYLKKEDRYVHKAYLNSKGGEREVDDFYEFTYLMTPDELRGFLRLSFNDDDIIDNIFLTSIELQNKINFYSLERKQIIPKVEVKDYEKTLSYFGVNNDYRDELDSNWTTIKSLLLSDEIQERYWINECLNALIDKDLWKDDYIQRIEVEADVIRGGMFDVLHDGVVGISTNRIMALPVTVQTEQDQIRFWQINREGSVRHHIDDEEAHFLCFHHQITQGALSISPEEGLAAAEEQDADSHIIELLHLLADLHIGMHNGSDVVDGTMFAFQIAFVRYNDRSQNRLFLSK